MSYSQHCDEKRLIYFHHAARLQGESLKPLLGSEESVMAGDHVEVSQNERNIVVSYIHGEEEKKDNLDKTSIGIPLGCCALPKPVRGFHNVVQVACGGGVQGCTAVVTATGKVFTFGSNFKGRLGHDTNGRRMLKCTKAG